MTQEWGQDCGMFKQKTLAHWALDFTRIKDAPAENMRNDVVVVAYDIFWIFGNLSHPDLLFLVFVANPCISAPFYWSYFV